MKFKLFIKNLKLNVWGVKTILLAVTFAVVVFDGGSWGVENPAMSNPASIGGVPPSSISNGLIRSPNPIDPTSSLAVTGNISGGKHFRGVVPYNAVSDFGGGAASTSLDSFLRRSAGTSGSGLYGYTGRSIPYYSETRTVTGAGATVSGIRKSTNVGRRDLWIQSRVGGTPGVTRYSPPELERLILDGVGTYAESKRISDKQNLSQMERLEQDLKRLRYRAPQLRQSLIRRDESLRPFSKLDLSGDVLWSFEQQALRKQGIEDRPRGSEADERRSEMPLDVYEQMKRQIDDFQKTHGLMDATKAARETAGDKGEPNEVGSEFSGLSVPKGVLGGAGVIGKGGDSGSLKGQETQEQKSSETAVSAVRAERAWGEYKSFASFSEDRFNQHMRAGEAFLKEGKYYLAADAYTLASIYKPDDPLGYAGKSHALFAAGEYMSSSLFLSRAIEIFPAYARFKVNIVAMVGDRDKVESRVADIEEWLKRNDAAELQFLLGYVYYQMGRLERAKEAIDAAHANMPTSAAVAALKRVIEEGSRTMGNK